MTSRNSYGVIFDVDGVLVDSAAPHLQSWQELAQALGATVTEAQFADTFGRRNDDIIPMLFDQHDHKEIAALADRKEEIYRELIRDATPAMPGAIDLVRALHADGVLLAIGSSGPRINIELVLTNMGIADRFSALVCAQDVTRGKPDPQVFSLGCERLGLPPNRCAVIEDAPAGITAACAAGTKAVGVCTHHGAEKLGHADLIVEKLADLSPQTLSQLIDGVGADA